jgi:hypothetical protein
MRFAVMTILLAEALRVASPAQAQTTVLDPKPPLAVAAYGQSLAWLRPRASGAVALIVRADPSAAPRVVVAQLPRRASQLGLGANADGRLTAVITAAPGARTALFSVPTDGSGPVRRLRLAPASVYAYAPGLRNGAVSFIRRGRGSIDGQADAKVMIGPLTGTRARVAGVLRSDYVRAAKQTAVAAGGLVLVAHVEQRRPVGGSVSQLISYRAGRRQRVLVRAVSHTGDGTNDNVGASGLGPIVLDASGRHATVARWAAPTDPTTDQPVHARRDLVTVDILTGAQTSQPVPGGFDIALPLAQAGFAVYNAGHDEYNADPKPARDATGSLQVTALRVDSPRSRAGPLVPRVEVRRIGGRTRATGHLLQRGMGGTPTRRPTRELDCAWGEAAPQRCRVSTIAASHELSPAQRLESSSAVSRSQRLPGKRSN